MTSRQQLIAVVAAIITVPLIFAFLGGGQQLGLTIGVVLVVGGLALGAFGPRRDER